MISVTQTLIELPRNAALLPPLCTVLLDEHRLCVENPFLGPVSDPPRKSGMETLLCGLKAISARIWDGTARG